MTPSHKDVWQWTLHPPFLHMERISYEDYLERGAEFEGNTLEPHTRTACWEGFPSARAWSILEINSRYKTLRQLDGGHKHIEVLHQLGESFLKDKDTTNVIIALFAGIGAALLSVPGIETTHWVTRAFFFAAILLALGGVIIGAMVPRMFSLFFGEDIDVKAETARGIGEMLTWQNHRKLLHGIWEIFAYQTSSITYSAVALVGGIFAFSITADFSTHAMSTNSQPHWTVFVITSLGPFVLYMAMFWRLLWKLSFWHRKARNEMKEPQELGPVETV